MNVLSAQKHEFQFIQEAHECVTYCGGSENPLFLGCSYYARSFGGGGGDGGVAGSCWNVLELAVGEGEKRAQRGRPQPHVGAEAAQCLMNAQETAAKLAIENFCSVRLLHL